MKNKRNENITHLNTYSEKKTLQEIRQYKRRKFVRMRTSMILIGSLIIIAIASIPLVKNLRATDDFHALHVQATTELEQLEDEKDELEYQVELLEDEEYIAKLARQELNVSKSNEILLNLPEKEETEAEEESEESEEESETNKTLEETATEAE